MLQKGVWKEVLSYASTVSPWFVRTITDVIIGAAAIVVVIVRDIVVIFPRNIAVVGVAKVCIMSHIELLKQYLFLLPPLLAPQGQLVLCCSPKISCIIAFYMQVHRLRVLVIR